MFNPGLQVEQVRLDDGNHCYIADEVLLEPDAAVRYAIDRRAQFEPDESSGYPGLTLAAPEYMAKPVVNFFNETMRRYVDARRLAHGMCRYSLVTLPPSRLSPLQSICHRDNSAVTAGQSISAAVLYLFRDERLGGTSFYAPARSPIETAQLFTDAQTMPSSDFQRHYGLPRTYMSGSNAYFTRIGTVAAKWNRLVFYDGAMLHSGDIPAPQKLSPDPSTGRLTLNFFFTCRRNLA
jgi:hypothetical protein